MCYKCFAFHKGLNKQDLKTCPSSRRRAKKYKTNKNNKKQKATQQSYPAQTPVKTNKQTTKKNQPKKETTQKSYRIEKVEFRKNPEKSGKNPEKI